MKKKLGKQWSEKFSFPIFIVDYDSIFNNNHFPSNKNFSPATVVILLIPIFDIKQTCKVVPTVNC